MLVRGVLSFDYGSVSELVALRFRLLGSRVQGLGRV